MTDWQTLTALVSPVFLGWLFARGAGQRSAANLPALALVAGAIIDSAWVLANAQAVAFVLLVWQMAAVSLGRWIGIEHDIQRLPRR